MQKLIMPFKKQMMLAGYKSPEYTKIWGYFHYGVDISTIQGGAGEDHFIYSSGTGTVLASGKDPKLGYALAILYPDVYNHHTGKRSDLVARYMHMKEIYVKTGDKLKTGTIIGQEGKEGTLDYHLHLEFDTDTKYPVNTPQVAARANAFWKKGWDTTVNPSFILHVGENQKIAEPTYNPKLLNEEDRCIPSVAGSPLADFIEDLRKLCDKYEKLI